MPNQTSATSTRPRARSDGLPQAGAVSQLLSGGFVMALGVLLAHSAAAQTEPPVAASAAASAPAADGVLPSVQVRGTSTAARDTKTLGQLLRAERIFEEDRAFAPQAVMMFKVYGRQDAGQWKAVDLGLLSPQGRLPVQLDEQGRFVVRDEWRHLDTDTELRSRLMDGKVTWRPDVRTPGSTAHLRRLGDLRLQCRASFFSGVARSGIVGTALGRFLKPLVNGCESKHHAWSSFADSPVFGIRLVHGDRALHLNQTLIGGLRDTAGSSFDWGYALRHQMFRLPMGDERWPDDARVEFELVADPQAPIDTELLQAPGPLPDVARTLQAGSTWDDIKAKLGREAGMVRYDGSGLRVVRYTQKKQHDFKHSLELVLLLDEQDRLIKFALRAEGEQRLAQAVQAPWSSKPPSP